MTPAVTRTAKLALIEEEKEVCSKNEGSGKSSSKFPSGSGHEGHNLDDLLLGKDHSSPSLKADTMTDSVKR